MDEVLDSTVMAAAGLDRSEYTLSQGESEAEGTVTTNVNPAPLLPPAEDNATAKDVDPASDEEEDDDDDDMCLCQSKGACCEFCHWVEFKWYWLEKYEDSDACVDLFDIAGWASCRCEACWREVDRNCSGVPIVRSQVHESPYMNRDDEYYAPYSSRALYDRSTAQELRQFVHNRGIDDPLPGGLTLKFCYIVALEKADRAWQFDLLGLPTELRLEIYRQVLVVDEEAKLPTAILRTCKSVCQEASDILYSERAGKCWFRVQAASYQLGRVPGQVPGCSPVYLGKHQFSSCLLRLHRLEISLYYRWIPGAVWDGYLPLNTYLLNLASFLMGNHGLKHLTIILDIDERMEEHSYGSILYPLRRLRNIQDVQIHGPIPERFRQRLIEEMKSSEPAYNTLRQMRLLLNESLQHIRLALSVVQLETECYCGDCLEPANEVERLSKLLRLRMSVLDSELEDFLSSALEENLQARLAELKSALDEVSVRQLQKLMEKAVEESNARKAASDDPSVLDRAITKWQGHLGDEGWKYGKGDLDWPELD